MSILSAPADIGGSALDPIAAAIKNPFNTGVSNGGERPQDFPGGFQIIEYVNGVPNKSTRIDLIGNMMPMQPFPWSGEQRMTKDYYAGNPEPVVQVLGAKEGPLTIKGRFKDKRYRSPSYYGVSYQYSLAINEMRKRGNLIKFGMDGTAGSWWRYGFLERVDFKMNKLSWIDYEIEFFVVSENQPVNNYFAAPEKQSSSAVNQNLIDSAAAFQANYSATPKSMPRSLADIMNGLISDVAKNINLVTNFVATVLNTAQEVENSANRALGLIKNARSSLSKFRRQFDSIVHNFPTLSTATTEANKARDSFKNLGYMSETISGTGTMAAYLVKMQAQFEAIARSVPKARYRVQNGDTLQNISIKFYGISDHWSNIYDHNKLQTTVLAQGTVLEIPNL